MRRPCRTGEGTETGITGVDPLNPWDRTSPVIPARKTGIMMKTVDLLKLMDSPVIEGTEYVYSIKYNIIPKSKTTLLKTQISFKGRLSGEAIS